MRLLNRWIYGFVFSPDEPAGGPSTSQDPNAAPAPGSSPASGGAPDDANELAKYKRLFGKADADLKSLRTELDALRAEKQQREEGELSASQKAVKRAEDAEKKAGDLEAKVKALETENLRRKIAGESGLKADVIEFLTGDTDEAIRAQADRLKGLMAPSSPAPGAPAPAKAGTSTNPGSAGTPSIDEQIAAASKRGDTYEAVRLKRLKAGFGQAET